MNQFYDFQKVLEAVPAQIDQLVTTLFPEAKRQGASYRTGNENGEKGRSFAISTRLNNAGCYLDYSDPSVKGNAIALVALAKGMAYDEAGQWLAKFLNVPPEQRMEVKSRPKPQIEKDSLEALNQKSISYAAGRGISEDVLRQLKCCSQDRYIVMPHFNEEGETVMLKYWSCDDQKTIRSNKDPIPVLFGKHLIDPVQTGGMLIITEGHWDAMTWIQLGYPAVSIPNGVNNHEWIAEDWTFLNRFSEIYLDFDDDQPGRDCEVIVKGRLGHDRCKSVKYRFKDANEALKAGQADMLIQALKDATEAPIEKIVRAQDIKQEVRDRLNGTKKQTGTPFFLPSLGFEFRPHEITLWVGRTSHGKSTVLSNQIAYAASLGKGSFVASFEQATPMTLSAMLVQYTADPDISHSSNFDEAFDDLTSKVIFYDAMQKANPKELIDTMIVAHKQLGITEFVIDNVMTLEIDRQDNSSQADAADMIRVFAARYPVHVHVVAHPKKPSEESSGKPPSVSDIRGASEWGDMPHNVLTVYRDVAKSERISTMYDEGISATEIQIFRESMPDGKIFVRKQRETGDLPIVSYNFDKSTKRCWKNIEDMAPYFYPSEH